VRRCLQLPKYCPPRAVAVFTYDSQFASAAYAPQNCMDTVEVRLLKYAFRFRPLSWREELGMVFPPKADRRRVLLSHALAEISGLKVNTAEEGLKVMDALPISVVHRVFILYRAALPEPRVFTTIGLYKAEEPNAFHGRIEKSEEETERIMDRVEQEMAQKFGRAELAEQRAQEAEMLKNSRGVGLTKATPENAGPTPTVVKPPAAKGKRPWTTRRK